MREVVITPILYGFDQKVHFLRGGLGLKGIGLKRLKVKVRKGCSKLAVNLFALRHLPILNRAENELTDSRFVKTIKMEKYRFHCFIDCNVEVTCIVTVIILENMFGNIKSAVFTYWIIGQGECAAELACLQMLNISLRKIFKVGTILVLTHKNQPTN